MKINWKKIEDLMSDEPHNHNTPLRDVFWIIIGLGVVLLLCSYLGYAPTF